MKTLLALALLAAGLFSHSAFAQIDCKEGSENYRVFFVNGIRTSLSSAVTDKYELLAAVGGSHNSQAISYDLSYNYTSGTLVDLLQSIEQRIAQEGLRFDRRVMSWLNELGVVPDWLLELNQRLYSTIHTIQASELSDHIAKYREAILQGQKVLLVAHSQGNLYANASFDLLASSQPPVPMQSFGIFGVAAPTSYIAGGGDYLTNHRDIIYTVSIGSLGPNWTLRHNNAMSTAIADDVGRVEAHGFSDAYLAPWFNVRPQIQARIRSALNKLVDPPEIVGSGPITVTMTWNTDLSDVDLHVVEPNNMHIYYASPYGTSGYLDVDDINGYGPEHYYTDCNQLQLGEYLVGVNYFNDHQAGSALARPAVAEFTVSVPGATRTFRTTLTSAEGPAGDQSPLGIGRVKVERISSADPNLNQRLKYSIFPY